MNGSKDLLAAIGSLNGSTGQRYSSSSFGTGGPVRGRVASFSMQFGLPVNGRFVTINEPGSWIIDWTYPLYLCFLNLPRIPRQEQCFPPDSANGGDILPAQAVAPRIKDCSSSIILAEDRR